MPTVATTKKEMLEELDGWIKDGRCPSTAKAIAAVRKAVEKVRAKPQRIGITGQGGMMIRWDSPRYVFKLRIDAEGTLDDAILKAIDMLPIEAGIYGAGGTQER